MVQVRVRVVSLAAMVLALAAFGAISLSRATAAGPTVSVSSLNGNVGVVSKVNLKATGIAAPGLGAWTVDVHYDPARVTILACAPAQGGLCNPHYNATTVRVTGTNVYGLQGDVDLASIGLSCTAAGAGQLEVVLSVFADATIGGPQPIAAATQNGSITCTTDAQPTATPTHGSEATPTPTPSVHKLPGDADCNGVVNSIDATIILQYVARLIGSVPCPNNADVNHDGVISAVDAAIVLQKVAGLI
jgi:hypothetical protein